jgi:protein required for attachment to host cells
MKATTWVLVSDASRARLFRVGAAEAAPWQTLLEVDHPEGRAHGRETTTDRPGRFALDFGKGFQNQAVPRTTPHQREAERFASTLAGALERGLAEGAYQALVVVAPPYFLGLLREAMSSEVSKHIVGSLHKDYTHLDGRALRQRIEPLFH